MLVLDENRLMGINREHFDLLERFMVRDRNHPSVILWSIGNEEWAIEGNEKGARITKTMQEFAQKIDSSRAFTVAVSGGWDNGSGKTVQVMGYNYIVQGNIDEHHAKFPGQCGIGTEESNTIGTRGVYSDDKANGRMAATNRMPENVGTESGWKFYAERPFLSGLFFWTGFDYRGEANPLLWPAVNSEFGIVDLCGFPKDIYYYLKSWWGNKPVMHIMPHWNWKGSEGKTIKVTIYSNAEEVELVLNRKSLGKKHMPINGHIDWDVFYMPGTLLAKGTVKGKMIVSEQIETTDVPLKLALSSDRTQLIANGSDVAIITVQLNDLKNRFVPTANNEITFSLIGPGKIIGVGNGDPASHDPEQFVDGVDRLNIVDLSYKLSESSQYLPENVEGKAESGWSQAFQKGYGEYENGKLIFIRGYFNLDSLTENKTITFYARDLVKDQSIYINGKLLPANLTGKDSDNVYRLDHNLLHNGINTVTFVGKPLVKKMQWEELNTNPGTIKVHCPAGIWKRKLFNGYAQILIKTNKYAGDITLKATSVGMIPANLKMQSTGVYPVISEVEKIK